MRLKHRVMQAMSATVAGECLALMLANAWRGVRRPVYPSSIREDQFDRERDRLWRHLNQLLPMAGYDLGESCLSDQAVLVIGVGSTFAFALLLLALGARRVICIDPFLRDTDHDSERKFAEYLLSSIPWPAARQRGADHIARARETRAATGFLVDGDRIRFHQVPLEETGGPLDREAPFDLIISNAVLEHLKDVPVAMRRFKQLLEPTGGMAHAFGFMNHMLFASSHSQRYLTFSPRLWSLMTSKGSPPNRCSLSHFRRAAEAAGLTGAEFMVTATYSPEETEYAMRHAHPAVVADNAADMSAHHVTFRVLRQERPTSGGTAELLSRHQGANTCG
jgi:SAM-dependent methyltransferase